MQPRERVFAVALLRAVPLRLDDDHALGRDALVRIRAEARLERIGQRRGADVEAKVHRRRHLVDVLPARALRTHGGPFHFGGVDFDHGRGTSSTRWYALGPIPGMRQRASPDPYAIDKLDKYIRGAL